MVNANPGLEVRGSYEVGDVREIHVEDIEGDHSLDVIIASNDGVYVLNSDATIKWTYPVENLKTVFVSDRDGDGYKEVLISSGRRIANLERGNIHIIDKEGNLVLKCPKGMVHSNFISRSIYAIDLNHDRYQEVICGIPSGVYTLRDTFDGEFTWGFKTNETITGIRVRDLEGAGNEEIVANSFSNIYLVDLNGTPRGRYGPIGEGIKKLNVANILQTGGNEIILVSNDDMIHILDIVDNEPELYLKTRGVNNILEVSTLDLNGDGLKEVIVGSENGVYIMNNGFTVVAKYETNDDVCGIHLADWEGDGVKEIVFGSGNYIYSITSQGDLKDKYDVGQRIDRFIQEDLDYDGYIDVVINSGSKVYLLKDNESGEFRMRNKAERDYMDAKYYFRGGRYDDAIESINKSIGLYGRMGDTVNVKKCESLKKEIESRINEDKRKVADSYYKSAEEYLLKQDYENARRELENASVIYSEINDLNGTLKCIALSLKIDEKINEEEVRDRFSAFKTPGGEISIFFIFSVFLLIMIVLLLISLTMGRK
ncbi:MAG: VCBS repeat-containing protein [Candidatus Altiarchaeota archaeon]|nr:VCBS repeat-containing protein [Candidatus Altiarchaeota archaeon]